MRDLLFGPVLLSSLLAGVVALLAPCCVSVMLPAYLSTVFRRRAGVLAATLVFAAGVATVIVPIGMGATALSAAFQRWHTPLFTAGGLAMTAGGVAVLAGWSPKIPMPGMRPSANTGVGAVYGLGVFSGVASACCAPVLVGVSVLAGATASFPAALSVSAAYVVGMVAPLLALSLGWERYGTCAARALQSRRVPLRPGGRRRAPLGRRPTARSSGAGAPGRRWARRPPPRGSSHPGAPGASHLPHRARARQRSPPTSQSRGRAAAHPPGRVGAQPRG